MTNLNALLASSPDIRHGRPCIVGTRITVHRIAIWYRLGYSAEEICHQYPHLTLAGVYGAIAYYHANRESIEVDLESDEAEAKQLEQEYVPKSPVLQ
jgi:uncharacterized protein (DUF433 family)